MTSVKKVTEIVSEITAASQEQSAGIDQVNKAVTQMDQVVQGNAAQVEELSSTAQSMAGQGQQLQALVKRFRFQEERGGVFRSAPTVQASAPAAHPTKIDVSHRRLRSKRAQGAQTAELELVGARAGNGSGHDDADGFVEF
jgi:hypothetical protein